MKSICTQICITLLSHSLFQLTNLNENVLHTIPSLCLSTFVISTLNPMENMREELIDRKMWNESFDISRYTWIVYLQRIDIYIYIRPTFREPSYCASSLFLPLSLTLSFTHSLPLSLSLFLSLFFLAHQEHESTIYDNHNWQVSGNDLSA